MAAARHTVLAADAFAALAELRGRGERFGLVIVDPPALAKREDEVGGALAAYARLTRLALGVLAPGGTLVMASCSSRVSAERFFATVNGAAQQAGRSLHEIDRTGHAIDHPVRFPEGAYLKCLFATARRSARSRQPPTDQWGISNRYSDCTSTLSAAPSRCRRPSTIRAAAPYSVLCSRA